LPAKPIYQSEDVAGNLYGRWFIFAIFRISFRRWAGTVSSTIAAVIDGFLKDRQSGGLALRRLDPLSSVFAGARDPDWPQIRNLNGVVLR